MPPPITHKQQQALATLINGSADNTPITRPPKNAGWPKPALVVVLTAKVRDQFFALQVPQRVLQLHQLDEQIVLRIQAGCVNRALEVKRQPFLNAMHAGAVRQVEEQRHVENDRRSENAVAAQKIDLQLHRIAEPADQIDVVPAFFVVAA